MTPKDKAQQLIYAFEAFVDRYDEYELAKQCAAITVDELIYETQFEVPNIRQRYWQEVKQEIENL
jgi:crotonobetainyl-CoA:carnitine CoA-transferase CaiB-like acyl-CoA transferase